MAVTIKTQLFQELVIALKTASDIQTVERFNPIPTDLDSSVAPIAYIFESTPEIRETNNRFARGVLELDIMVFIELQSKDKDTGNLTFLDLADSIEGQIHNILLGPGHNNLRGLALKVIERSVEKVIPNDIWGILVYTVEITYQHLMGDAFNK